MSESAPSAAVALLAKALDHLAINGHAVTLDGDPPHYEVNGQPTTEGEIVALAFQLGTSGPQ